MTVDTDPQGISPVHTSELDHDLARTLHRTRRLQALAIGVLGFLLVSGFVVAGSVFIIQHRQIATQQRELQAGCSFFGDLAGLSVRPVPPLKRPSKLSVVVVSHARTAYIGLECRPPLRPPDPSLVFWARRYGVAVP